MKKSGAHPPCFLPSFIILAGKRYLGSLSCIWYYVLPNGRIGLLHTNAIISRKNGISSSSGNPRMTSLYNTKYKTRPLFPGLRPGKWTHVQWSGLWDFDEGDGRVANRNTFLGNILSRQAKDNGRYLSSQSLYNDNMFEKLIWLLWKQDNTPY